MNNTVEEIGDGMVTLTQVDFDDLDVSDDGFGDVLYRGHFFTGIAYEYDEQTNCLIGLAGFKDGHHHGPSRAWDSSGQIRDETFYRSGVLHGPRRTWDGSGRLTLDAFYLHGVKIKEKKWNASGEVSANYDVDSMGTPREMMRLQEAKSRQPATIIDISSKSWEISEKPMQLPAQGD